MYKILQQRVKLLLLKWEVVKERQWEAKQLEINLVQEIITPANLP